MSGRTSIEWAERVWNPTRGCSMAAGSECGGCANCYAARQALRMSYHGGKYEGLVRLTENGPRWTGKVVQGDIDAPLHVRKPCRWFVDSMSDLFHESIPDEWIDRAFAVMALCPHHTFQVLTKRAHTANVWFRHPHRHNFIQLAAANIAHDRFDRYEALARFSGGWPLSNVWLGVSVEDEKTARLRLPPLLATPASVRWVSYEPALGPVDWMPWLFPDPPGGKRRGELRPGLDWLVVGGESGPGARPFDLAWARNAIEQCRAAGVPVFVKQLGARPFVREFYGCHEAPEKEYLHLKDRKGAKMEEWPEDLRDLRVREYPKIAG